MKFGEFCETESVTDRERKFLAEILVVLRRHDAKYGSVSFRNILTAVQAASYRAGCRACESSDQKDLLEMEGLDAAANLVLFVWENLDRLKPMLAKFSKARPV